MSSGAATARTYRADVLEHNFPARLPAGTRRVAYVRVINRSDWTWQRSDPDGHSVDLAFFIGDRLAVVAPLPAERLAPGEEAIVSFKWHCPSEPGTYRVKLDMVHQNVAFFQSASEPLGAFAFEVTPHVQTASERAMATALERNYWFYVPTEGVYWAADGSHYPLFVREAKGATFIDAEGHEYIDYVMGWGACFLGYAAAPIVEAVARTLSQTPLSTLPNLLELELCEALAARFPCAEMTLFGKNGSDVTTAAVRLARNATGRPFVLFGGYHGWHDWNSPSLGNEPASADFGPGDLAAVEAHFAQRPGQIAAVVVEPAARVGGIDGPVSAADADFLGALRRLCDREGSLLVYDEIWTGFRYLDGSVMAHTGVIPDLACLGKALANGMPLAALIGRSEIFRSAIHRINYTPTFKGEVYSFAAALAALEVYRERDVAAEVWAYGRRLMQALDERFGAAGVPLAMSGLPVRMVPAFQIDDVRRRTLARTLLQQELLKAGIVSFRGFMLPCAAHGEREFEQTLAAFDRALPVVRRALESNGFARVLEVPEIG